jgi:hypothetical protein
MIKDIINSTGLNVSEGIFIQLGYEDEWNNSKSIKDAYDKLLEYNRDGRTYYSIINRYTKELRWYLNDSESTYVLSSLIRYND